MNNRWINKIIYYVYIIKEFLKPVKIVVKYFKIK